MTDVLRCYCCGEPVGDKLALVAMQTPTDRVFVMTPEHSQRADGATIMLVSLPNAPVPR